MDFLEAWSRIQVQLKQVGAREMASTVNLCSCRDGRLIGGHTDSSTGIIKLNTQAVTLDDEFYQKISGKTLTHEIGHMFFGSGHSNSRGIMDYNDEVVRKTDIRNFQNRYKNFYALPKIEEDKK